MHARRRRKQAPVRAGGSEHDPCKYCTTGPCIIANACFTTENALDTLRQTWVPFKYWHLYYSAWTDSIEHTRSSSQPPGSHLMVSSLWLEITSGGHACHWQTLQDIQKVETQLGSVNLKSLQKVAGLPQIRLHGTCQRLRSASGLTADKVLQR